MNTTKRTVPRGTENLFPGKGMATLVLETLGQDLKIYEEKLAGKNYNFTFTNGNYISLEIKPEDLFQLLGFTPERVSKEGQRDLYKDLNLDFDASHLEYMRAIVDNADYIVERDYRKLPIIINYYKVARKHELFRTFIDYDFSQFNFGLIDFSKKVFAENGFSFSRKSSQLIYLQQDVLDRPVVILGALGENVADKTLEGTVETIIDPYNYRDFFSGQEVALAESFCIGDPAVSPSYENTDERQLQGLERLFSISSTGTNQDIAQFGSEQPVDISIQCAGETIPLDDQGFTKVKKFLHQTKHSVF